MSYTIDFSDSDPKQKAARAIEAAEDYLGDKFSEIIGLFTLGIEKGELTTRKHVHIGMSLAGIQGYPVAAIIEKYWPTLPA
jgi:hypothetical protein